MSTFSLLFHKESHVINMRSHLTTRVGDGRADEPVSALVATEVSVKLLTEKRKWVMISGKRLDC